MFFYVSIYSQLQTGEMTGKIMNAGAKEPNPNPNPPNPNPKITHMEKKRLAQAKELKPKCQFII